MRFLLVLFVACAGFGCTKLPPQVPGNGQLAVVDIDDGFAANWLDDDSNLSELDAVRAGVHYWNSLGANLKTSDELTTDEAAVDLPRFSLHRDSFSWPSEGDSAPNGICWPDLGYATIYPNAMRAAGLDNYVGMREVVAHEIGHAIGMGHSPANINAVMNPGGGARWVGDLPSRTDREAYCALYPGCATPRSIPAR